MRGFKKLFVCLLSGLLLFSTAVAQDDRMTKGYRYAAANTVYLQYDAWSLFGPNFKIVSERNQKGAYIGTEEFKNYLKKIPASYNLYLEYESKLMLSSVVIIGGTLASAGLVYFVAGNLKGGDASSYLLLMGGYFVLFFGTMYAGTGFRSEALNSFYKSLNEYNKAIITAGFRQAGMPAIQYNRPF
jgi:hypothetical protein